MGREVSQWKPGQSGNPSGQRPDPHRLKEVRKMTKDQIAELGSLLLQGDIDEIMKIQQTVAAISNFHSGKTNEVPVSHGVSVLKAWIVSVALKGIQRGDPSALNVVLDRIVGKVKEEIEHSGTVSGNQPLSQRVFDNPALQQKAREFADLLEKDESADKGGQDGQVHHSDLPEGLDGGSYPQDSERQNDGGHAPQV